MFPLKCLINTLYKSEEHINNLTAKVVTHSVDQKHFPCKAFPVLTLEKCYVRIPYC